jgi:L-threonylcarbamoyladenylate synthase
MTSSNTISEAARVLRDGGLVAFPTETVYGLGADATRDAAVAKVYAAKGRPTFNPLIVHVSEPEDALRLGTFDSDSKRLAEAFWPGPLTLVVRRRLECPVSLLASAGLPTIALRVPAHPVALELLRSFGGPIVAPSANLSGRISPTTALHVHDGLGAMVNVILDGGRCAVGVESSVVRVMDDGPTLLRAGGLARDDINRVLGRAILSPQQFDELHSPGQLASHYAPQSPLRLNATQAEAGEVYLGFGNYSHGPHSLSQSGNVVEAAANLFRLLHEIDAHHPRGIAVAPIPSHGLGEAINDRLTRAAAPR